MDNNDAYKFRDKDARVAYLNKQFINACIILWLGFLLYVFIKWSAGTQSLGFCIFYTVLVAVLLIVNTVFCMKKPTYIWFKDVVASEMGVLIILFGIQTDATFIFLIAPVMMAIIIPFFSNRPSGDLKRLLSEWYLLYLS